MGVVVIIKTPGLQMQSEIKATKQKSRKVEVDSAGYFLVVTHRNYNPADRAKAMSTL